MLFDSVPQDHLSPYPYPYALHPHPMASDIAPPEKGKAETREVLCLGSNDVPSKKGKTVREMVSMAVGKDPHAPCNHVCRELISEDASLEPRIVEIASEYERIACRKRRMVYHHDELISMREVRTAADGKAAMKPEGKRGRRRRRVRRRGAESKDEGGARASAVRGSETDSAGVWVRKGGPRQLHATSYKRK